jgi:hypothetical protein
MTRLINLNEGLSQLKYYKNAIESYNENNCTCNEFKEIILNICKYLVENNLGQDRSDTWDKQLESSIEGISNRTYGTINRKSLILFNSSKADALWFLQGFIRQIEAKIVT